MTQLRDCIPQRLSPARCLALLVLLGGLGAGTGALAESLLDGELAREAIADARELPRLQSLLVARKGEPVIEEVFSGGSLDQPVNIKSLSKTALAALVGIAIEKGVFDSVDQPIVELLGDRVPGNATPGVEAITVGHLLSLQAGLQRTSGRNYGAWVVSDDWIAHILTRPFVDKAGGRMLYSTGSSHLLSAALTEAAGKSTLELARAWLGEPLGITIPAWPRDPQGIYFGGNDMVISARGLLKIGEVYRRGGEFNGQQILPAAWVTTSWQGRGRSAYTDDPYGYGWFMLELAGEQAYYGRGFGGQMLYVIPGLDMTVVMTSDPTPPSPGSRYLRQLHRLVESYLVPAARQASAAANERLQSES